MTIFDKVRNLENAAYIAGFEEAKRLALEAIRDTDVVEWRDTQYAQLGDAQATLSAAAAAVALISPVVKGGES